MRDERASDGTLAKLFDLHLILTEFKLPAAVKLYTQTYITLPLHVSE